MEKLTWIKRETSDKKGDPLLTKDGRLYTRLVIKVESRGDRYISGFGNQDNAAWQVGDEVDITITESDKKDNKGQSYLNFSMPKKGEMDGALLREIHENTEMILNRLVGIKIDIEIIKGELIKKAKKPLSDDEWNEPEFSEDVNPDDVPF